MTPQAQTEAAALLWRHWQEGRRLPALPPSCRPTTRSEAYAVQSALLTVSRRGQFGWKIAATSAAGQAHIGVEGPLAGRLLDGQIDASGAEVELGSNQMRVAEPEFAFRMGRDLLPRMQPYGVNEVLDAVATLHPAIEVPDSRYEAFATAGAAQLIADNACAHRFVLASPANCDWRSIDLRNHPVHAAIAGKLARDGIGSNVLSGPDLALAWLANELSALDIPLRAGQVVTTGTCMAPLPIAAGDRLLVDFGPIGHVEAQFVA